MTLRKEVGVYWNKKLWLFYSTEDDSSNEIHYKTFTGSSMSDVVSLVDISEDLMALINNTPSHRYISLYHFDKKSGSWRSSDSFDAGGSEGRYREV